MFHDLAILPAHPHFMDLDTFNHHKMKDRARLVWQQGTFLANRYEDNHLLELYYMGDFYAEVWYAPRQGAVGLIKSFLRWPALAAVRSFTNQDCLYPYLERIRLSDL